MPNVLALPDLFTAVETRFSNESTVCDMVFGWKTPNTLSPTTSRITWVPGSPSGALGDVSAPRHPHRNPRSLATLTELATLTIQTFSSGSGEPLDELAQYTKCRLLYDALYRAIYLARHGAIKIVSSEWVRPKSGMSHGVALQVVIAIEAILPDAPYVLADDVSAQITSESLDHSETLLAPNP